MSRDKAQLDELRLIHPGAEEHVEGPYTLILLPQLTVHGVTMKGVLCAQEHGGYLTRLFLEKPVGSRSFSQHVLLNATWYTWSWQGVSAGLRLAQILALHMRAI